MMDWTTASGVTWGWPVERLRGGLRRERIIFVAVVIDVLMNYYLVKCDPRVDWVTDLQGSSVTAWWPRPT